MLNCLPREMPEPIGFLFIAQYIDHFHGLSRLGKLFCRGPIGFRSEHIGVGA